ncbi:MAG: hypothetical protein HXY37_03815 [Chloroflexi bacterium]|nr:hypothetical protein [Chloroflexota bacterium]
MATRTVRRLYIYVAAFIGLWMMSFGVSGLLAFLATRLFGGAALGAGVAALRLGSSVALIVVGAPLWAGHWALAQRDARQPEGQFSALRRLYAYAVLLVAALVALFGLQEALTLALDRFSQRLSALELISPLANALVAALVWLAHWRFFSSDRELVERAAPHATLRRWYLALILWISLALTSFGAGVLIHGLLQQFVFSAPGYARQLAGPAAALISGVVLWLPHELWSRRLVRVAGPLQIDELGAILRQVYMALVIASSLVAALTGLTALLAAGLQASLGVTGWANAFAGETRAAAALIVALPILFYHREQLVVTARLSGAEERVGTARRLISYLLAAVSLVALYFGLGGLIGTLLRLWLGAEVVGSAWLTALSWYAATAIVALPVYGLAGWWSERLVRANVEEQRVLSRRIYLYAGLLFGVIAAVTATTGLISTLVVALLGQGGPEVTGDVGWIVGYSVLALAIAVGYGLLLRQAGAARGTLGAGRRIVLVAAAPLRQALEAAVRHELPGATLAAFDEQDTPERRAALASADVLVLSLAALGDATLASFTGPRLLLATPLEGMTLIGARREGSALAREAARTLRSLCSAGPPLAQPPAIDTAAHSPA